MAAVQSSTAAAASADANLSGEVAVLLPLPLDSAYDYRLADGVAVPAGSLVRVPLGPRRLVGVVWGPGSRSLAPERLRLVSEIIDLPPLDETLRHFVEWVASYTMSGRGAVLRLVLSVPAAFDPPRPRILLAASGIRPAKLTAKRQRVLEVVADGPPRPPTELAREAGVTLAVVQRMVELGALARIESAAEPARPKPDPARAGLALSSPQAVAAAFLRQQVGAGGFAVSLLDGVTGSGKTEVYFEAIAAALANGRQALVLLPEIALSAQFLRRFEARFGAPPAEWHSELTPARRRGEWRAVARGGARVVVGARSALFLPYPALGLIVVDEEHDGAFKQEEGVVYNARDMAVVRARLSGIPVLLVSATPSLESHHNAETGRYRRLHLPDRHGLAGMPGIATVDLRAAPPTPGSWLSPPLVEALAATLAAGDQAMLFLNRRGYAPLTLCRACGHRLQCPNCTAWLVEHRLTGLLRCHHCGHSAALPTRCPACDQDASLVACGPGVERVAEECARRFPAARLAVMTSDTVAGPGAAAALVERMTAHDVDLLIGTQMVTKGHHFPNLTLVGVVDADLGLAGGDLRAGERTFQLLSQVAGRAGRAERPGQVLLQTYMPEHPVMRALAQGDRDGFLAAELDARRTQGMPPITRLAALIVSASAAGAAESTASLLARRAPRAAGVEVLGPAPAPLAVLRGRHRFRLLLKAPRAANVQALLRAWLGQVHWPKSVRVQVDIDPYSFL